MPLPALAAAAAPVVIKFVGELLKGNPESTANGLVKCYDQCKAAMSNNAKIKLNLGLAWPIEVENIKAREFYMSLDNMVNVYWQYYSTGQQLSLTDSYTIFADKIIKRRLATGELKMPVPASTVISEQASAIAAQATTVIKNYGFYLLIMPVIVYLAYKMFFNGGKR